MERRKGGEEMKEGAKRKASEGIRIWNAFHTQYPNVLLLRLKENALLSKKKNPYLKAANYFKYNLNPGVLYTADYGSLWQMAVVQAFLYLISERTQLPETWTNFVPTLNVVSPQAW